MRLHPIGSRSSLSQRPDLRRRGASRSFGAEGAGAWSRLLAPLAACSVGDPTTGGETLRIDEASASEPLPPTLLTREAMAVPSASLRPPSPPPSPHQQMVTLLVPAADLTGSVSARRPKMSQPVSTGRADRRNHLKGSEPTASFGSGRAGYAESWFGDAGQTGALAHQHQLQHQARKGGSATASEWAAIQRERSVAACLHHRESIAEESGQALQLVASVPTMEEGGGRGHGGRSGCGGGTAPSAPSAASAAAWS